MARIALLGGAYEARGLIASAQRCVNLYPERNPQDAEAPVTHYPTPGTVQHFVPPTSGVARCLYTATNGRLYYVCGQKVYYIDSNFVPTTLGTLTDVATTPVSIIDNGQVAIVVDGSTHGYGIKLTDNTFGAIVDPNFLGADRVDYTDTFFVLNQPGTKNFYSSLSNVTYDSLCTNPGRPVSGTITNAGSGGTDATYLDVALTGGTGTGAHADITVSGGAVTVVTLRTNDGLGYTAGDILSATIAGPLANFEYTLTDVAAAAFDPTYIAAKTGFPDQLATLCCVHREILLFGAFKTAEVWYDAGGALFPFAIMPGIFIEHGCVAKYSVCKHDLSAFWLSIDEQGQGTVFALQGYRAVKISTPAIANEIAQYATISDAVGMMYKQGDHTFYVLTFPTADHTWVYDLTEGLWHERTWTDPDTGLQHRWRPQCMALAYGKILAGDYANGILYQLDLNTYTDNGGPIVRLRSFPHLTNDGKMLSCDWFIADMECGNGSASDPTTPPQVSLSWSVTRGRTFGTPLEQSLGAQGEYRTQPKWNSLGTSRDWVFQLQWSADAKTSLNGAFANFTPADN